VKVLRATREIVRATLETGEPVVRSPRILLAMVRFHLSFLDNHSNTSAPIFVAFPTGQKIEVLDMSVRAVTGELAAFSVKIRLRNSHTMRLASTYAQVRRFKDAPFWASRRAAERATS
jgi:hypothetical protein